jgi:hypothetical protein
MKVGIVLKRDIEKNKQHEQKKKDFAKIKPVEYLQKYTARWYWIKNFLNYFLGSECQICHTPKDLDMYLRKPQIIFKEEPENFMLLCKNCYKEYNDKTIGIEILEDFPFN